MQTVRVWLELAARRAATAVVALCIVISLSTMSSAQDLSITELMIDPIDEGAWEWLEVRNTTGSDIDLNGYFADRLGDTDIPSDGDPNIENTVASTTIVPAMGVAVIYDGFFGNGNPATHNDQLFRDAWGLDSSVNLISANFFPALTNSGNSIGFWPNRTAYDADLVDPELGGALCANPGEAENTCVVGGFSSAAFSIDYNGFPSANGQSVQWNGNPSNQNAANWTASVDGVDGAVTSIEVTLPGGGVDVGNPGIVPVGTPPTATPEVVNTGVFFTELLYDSGVAEDDWEWVEIYNNTGAAIDFSSKPYVFDDRFGTLGAANITSGEIAPGAVAVLFNADDLTPTQFADAWDPDGTIGTTLIGVTDWPALGNGGDLVALWDDFTDYTNDRNVSVDTTTNAAAAVVYDDDGLDWPDSNNSGSITLDNLGSDTTSGVSWLLSNEFDGVSFQITVDTILHAGGDVGSPGTFEVDAPVDVDLDDDGDVDGQDFLLIQQTNPDLIAAWVAQYPVNPLSAAAAVPEPATSLLFGLALAVAPAIRRKHG